MVVNPLPNGNMIGNGGELGAFAPEVIVRDVEAGGLLFPIPDDLPFDRAALAEPLGVGMHAVERVQLAAGEKVAIFGAGPIGLMALAALRWRGFDDVVIVDLSAKRLAIARELGAALTLDASAGDVWGPIFELHGTEQWLGIVPCAGTHAYIEASGAPSVIGDIIAHARPRARISVVALHRKPEPVDFLSLMGGDHAHGLDGLSRRLHPDGAHALRGGSLARDHAPLPARALRGGARTARDASVSGKVIIEP